MLITYFINQYPKTSHSFIRREILALENLGLKVQRIALRGRNEDLVDEDDILERKKTKYVLKVGLFKICLSVIRISSKTSPLFISFKVSFQNRGVTQTDP